jgi:hypothetical protein
MVIDLTPEAATSEWRFTAGTKTRSTKLAGTHTAIAKPRSDAAI